MGEYKYPKFIFIEMDPWNSVIGSDSPHFALYNNGQVIYLDREKRSFFSGELDQASLVEIDNLTLEAMGNEHQSFNEDLLPTSQPDNFFYFFRDGELFRKINIYGNLWENQKLLEGPLKNLFNHICSFKVSGAKPWLPQFIEVLLWDFSYAKTAIKWPDGLPGIDHERTQSSPSNNRLRIYLNQREFEILKPILETKASNEAVLLGDMKLALSYRFPFPLESLWMTRERDGESN